MSQLKAFLDDPTLAVRKPPGPRRAKALSPLEVAVDDASRRAESGDWEGAKGSSFIGLYALCHRMVYGILPCELQELGCFRAAAKQAALVAHTAFGDDPSEMAEFVRWAWEREKARAKWARSQHFDRNRMGWRMQFSRGLETDYRVAKAQRR